MTVRLKFDQAKLFKKAQMLFKSLGDVAADDFLKRDLAILTKNILYKRIKSGKGVNSDKSPFLLTRAVSLKPLSKQYKNFRRTGIVSFMAKRYHYASKKSLGFEVVKVEFQLGYLGSGAPNLGPFGRAGKSNLTMSGQMLESIQFDIKKYGYVILIPETKRREGKLTNAQVARFVAKQGRPFMNLTAGEIRIVKSRMREQIRKRLKKLLR